MSITAQDESQTRPADQAGRGARVFLWLTWARTYFSVPRWWLELAVIYSIYRIYSYIRNLGGKDVEPAFRHGTAVLDLEKKLHIDVEMSLNRLGEHFTILIALTLPLALMVLGFVISGVAREPKAPAAPE